jgi:hypothetical protein
MLLQLTVQKLQLSLTRVDLGKGPAALDVAEQL